ncbi:CLUMA_CG011787, isoform A [Clunio marinus]|uniref:CLUMA_CG011787, isoform A n=1 Tax=Clunio marinus TaxID=568069 RepID=A0A1J1IDV4_9DIPT|nr:CLUMA_CG011787, isoform A [Clunio marinus]
MLLSKFFLIIIITLNGILAQKLFIHQQNVEVTIPVTKQFHYELDVYPILHLTFTDLEVNLKSSYKFSLKKSQDVLTINEITGAVYFHRNKWFEGVKTIKNLKATVKNMETGATALTNLSFNFMKITQKEFCREFSCFFDHINYLSSEFNDRKPVTEEQIIGELSPQLYRRVCDDFSLLYIFKNGTDHVFISLKNQLIKEPKTDYEMMQIKTLFIDVTCELKDKQFNEISTNRKLLNITIVDRNDNLIYVDDESKKVEIFRENNEFSKNEIVNRSVIVIFRDRDSIEANSHSEIKVHGLEDIFKCNCSLNPWYDSEFNLTSSAFICDILFTRDGKLNQTKYCFQLKAFDVSIRKKPHDSAHICVYITKNSLTFNKTLTQSGIELSKNGNYEKSSPIFFSCDDSCWFPLLVISIFVILLIGLYFTFFFAARTLQKSQILLASNISLLDIEPQLRSREGTTSQDDVAIPSETVHCHLEFYSKKWEIESDNVQVEEIIGEGEFGRVMLASLKNQASVLGALKTVKNVTNDSELTSLKKEFEQLQKVSSDPHPNVIALLGCCSKGELPMIILEFCIFGSLKDYLLSSRLIKSRLNSEGIDKVIEDDILRFSFEISCGMAHLAKLKLVHRDLAARNILLNEQKCCKISDFGLMRNVCKSCNTYAKCSDDKIPIKWLPPEALTAAEEYTTKSDVWSFGILGYELVTLGGSPYPSIIATQGEFLFQLLNGARMKCPTNCSQQLFEIYESCWMIQPSDRPTFEELSDRISQLSLLKKEDNKGLTYLNTSNELWRSPEISLEEILETEKCYESYVKRLERIQSKFKYEIMKKEMKIERTSKAFSFPPWKPINSKKTMKDAKSINSIDNEGYDNNFDVINAMNYRLSKNTSEVPDSTLEDDKSKFDPVVSTNIGSSISQVSTSSGYITMNNFRNNSQK